MGEEKKIVIISDGTGKTAKRLMDAVLAQYSQKEVGFSLVSIYAEVRDKNFTAEELKVIRFFYLRGGFDFTRLPWYLKPPMAIMRWGLKQKKERNAEEQGLLDSFDAPVDFTDRENIRELVAYIRGK